MVSTSACPTENELLALVRGTIHEERDRVRAHIDTCETCQELLACALDSTTMAHASGPRAKDSVSVSLVGRSIGRYHVRDVLGAGAMGIVYLADDTQLDRSVAVKVLHGQHVEASERLTREAKALARLSHPNVIVVHEVGTFEDRVFMAMEFVDGCSLTAWLAKTERTTDEILRVFAQAARGLAVAHAAGLVHRDFKPDNVLVGHDGRVRVVDFGLAREDVVPLHVSDGDDEALARAPKGLGTLTRTGAFVGTPAYMAPEQYAGRRVDARTDQFGFAVALFEALYGRRPFEGDTIEALAKTVQSGDVQLPRRSGAARPVPSRVRRALLRALRVDPDERFASMDELIEALAPQKSRARAIAFVAMGAVVTAGAAWAGLRERSSPSALRSETSEPTSTDMSGGVESVAESQPAGSAASKDEQRDVRGEGDRPAATGDGVNVAASSSTSSSTSAAPTLSTSRLPTVRGSLGAPDRGGAVDRLARDAVRSPASVIGSAERPADAPRHVDAGGRDLFDTAR